MAKKKSTPPGKPGSGTTTSKRNTRGASKTIPETVNHTDEQSLEKNCEIVEKEVDKYLSAKCKAKVNKLSRCNKCEIENKDLPVIGSPFDAHLLNTGHDGAGGKIASGTGTDLYWEAGEGNTTGPSSVGTWIPAFVYRSTAWLASPFGNANWISVYHDSDHSGNKDIYFRLKFYLNSSINPGLFTLDMDFYADNSVWEIYVNNVPQSTHYPGDLPQNSTSPYSHVGFKKNKQVGISLAHDWKECENEIIVHVKSSQRKIGFLAQNASNCYEVKIPDLSPDIKITWGDSECDCLETNDFEVMCITVCNHYSNVTLKNFIIRRLRIVDAFGNPVPTLPDGTSSVELYPVGPFCFGDIGPCVLDDDGKPIGTNNCVTREFVVRARGAKAGKHRLLVEGVCFDICMHAAHSDCFEFELCKD